MKERGEERRDLSNRSLKTDGETERKFYIGISQKREGKREKEEAQRSE